MNFDLWKFLEYLKFLSIYFTLQYCIGFAIHKHASTMGVHVFPILNPLPPPFPSHPSGSSQCTNPEHPASCIEPGLVIYFTYDNILFNAILSNHPTLTLSHRVSKTVLYICVSFAVSHTGLSLHLSKFHIYGLVYCIGVFLSGLLHSVHFHFHNPKFTDWKN